MIKKLVAFAATALISLNASAGYVQYDFHFGPDGRGLDGYIVQHDTDQSIALFSFQLNDPVDEDRFGGNFYPVTGEGDVLLTGATTYFRNNGPTNFTIEDYYGADHFTTLSVTFSRGKGGNFIYTAKYFADLFENQPPVTYAGTLTGSATRGTVDPDLAAYLDLVGGYEYALPHIVPTYIGPNRIPEPTSLALLALGAVGLSGAGRRRQSATQDADRARSKQV